MLEHQLCDTVYLLLYVRQECMEDKVLVLRLVVLLLLFVDLVLIIQTDVITQLDGCQVNLLLLVQSLLMAIGVCGGLDALLLHLHDMGFMDHVGCHHLILQEIFLHPMSRNHTIHILR